MKSFKDPERQGFSIPDKKILTDGEFEIIYPILKFKRGSEKLNDKGCKGLLHSP